MTAAPSSPGCVRCITGTEERITGDAKAGRGLFFGSAGCSRCHMFGAQGGRLGPNLSRIVEEKNIAELKKAITDPDDSLREGYRTAEVRTERRFPDPRCHKK